jgi:WD40 repeat protein
MADEVSPNTPIITPNRLFESHEKTVAAVAVFLDGCRMVTASFDKTLHLWDLKDGVPLKKMEGHSGRVKALGVSGDMRWIASGDDKGELIAWDGDTGEPLTQAIKVHSEKVWSLDFSPDGTVLATGSWDKTTKLWCTKTWQVQGDSINCGRGVDCVRFSPSSELLAIATWDIQIWHLRTRKCLVKLGSLVGPHISLSWTPDGTRLLSGDDTTVWEWDTLTWQQIGDPWSGHTEVVRVLAVNSSGTLVASASDDNHIYLWQLSDRRIIAIFKHFDEVYCVTFSADGKYIFSGGRDMKISEWAVPTNFLLVDSIEERASQVISHSLSNCCRSHLVIRTAHAKGSLLHRLLSRIPFIQLLPAFITILNGKIFCETGMGNKRNHCCTLLQTAGT